MKKVIFTTVATLAVTSSVMAKNIIVDQKDKTFIPTKVEANVGDKIVFKNSDGFAHNAFTDNEENEFDIGMQKPGEDVSVEMKAPGVVEVECAIHPNMHLEILVK